MDRRIIKTKRSLKEALIELMNEKSFEKITVTEICDRAYTSRITFYTYYTDKYSLLHDIFMDQEIKGEQTFVELQKNNNPKRDPVTGINNLVQVLSQINIPGVKSTSYLLRNTDLLFFYFNFLNENLEKLEKEFSSSMTTDYTLKNLNTFLILGLWGYIHADSQDNIPQKTIDEVCRLIEDLMNSRIFRPRQPGDPELAIPKAEPLMGDPRSASGTARAADARKTAARSSGTKAEKTRNAGGKAASARSAAAETAKSGDGSGQLYADDNSGQYNFFDDEQLWNTGMPIASEKRTVYHSEAQNADELSEKGETAGIPRSGERSSHPGKKKGGSSAGNRS